MEQEVIDPPVEAPAPKLTYDIAEVAEILNLKLTTARQLASTDPERLPPRINTGGRKVLFLRSVVHHWLEQRSGQ